jgi:hypothetical protein
MPLTEEQRTEIQQEVSRLVETWLLSLSPKDILSSPGGDRQRLETLPIWGNDESSIQKVVADILDREGERAVMSSARVRGIGDALQTPSHTQLLEPLVRVIARAVEVLGTSEKALRWINAPIRSLNNQPPISLLNTPEGITRVEDALGRIEHGVW